MFVRTYTGNHTTQREGYFAPEAISNGSADQGSKHGANLQKRIPQGQPKCGKNQSAVVL